MDLIAPIALMLVLIRGDAQVTIEMHPQPSDVACWEAARRFIHRDPAEFNAIAIGAGCVIHPNARGANNES